MEIQNQRRRGLLFSMMSGASWGTFGVFTSLCLAVGVTDYTIVALAPAALLVYFALRVCMKPKVLKGIPIWIIIGMFLQGGLLNNFMNYAYTQAYTVGMPVAVVSTVAFCHIFVIMIEAYFLFKQKITLQKAITAIVAVVGVSLVLGLFSSTDGEITFIGIIWTLIIAITLGTNIICNSYWLDKGVDSDAFLFILSIGSLVVMFIAFVNPIAFVSNIVDVLSTGGFKSWLSVLGFIAIPNILCYAIMMEGLKRVDPSAYAICYSLDPVTATILGIIVFSQIVTGTQIIGIIIILLAVGYLNWMEGKEDHKVDMASS